jgi:ribonuclease J
MLTDDGIHVITEMDEFVHVSGHPARDELAEMYRIVKPRIAVPVHGEARHLKEHCALALSLGVEQAVEIKNGDVLKLAPGNAEIIGTVPSGRFAVDVGGLTPLDGEFLSTRRRMIFNGAVSALLIVDEQGAMTEEPVIRLRGVVDEELFPGLQAQLRQSITRYLKELTPRERKEDSLVEEAAGQAIRRVFRKLAGRRPISDVYVVRIDDYDEDGD